MIMIFIVNLIKLIYKQEFLLLLMQRITTKMSTFKNLFIWSLVFFLNYYKNHKVQNFLNSEECYNSCLVNLEHVYEINLTLSGNYFVFKVWDQILFSLFDILFKKNYDKKNY